ncbi:MAG TPA: DUF4440 domain-containing protein [Allosphingosinicella sp.]|jgi:ketosteroid isomerase-like protein
MIAILQLLLAPAVTAAAPATPLADPREVVATERAFARYAAEKGIGPAFRSFVAEDGIVFVPEPARAKPLFEKGDPPGTLEWWPGYAGIAVSGDLGFTTGPFVSRAGNHQRHGHFFTIWRRQADGSWRWVVDQGPETREPSPLGRDAAVTTLAAGERAAGGSGRAWEDLLKIEAGLARSLAADAPGALAAVLADDGRTLRDGPQPAIGRAAFSESLRAGPASIEAVHLGGGISAAGDLAYTYGRASWTETGSPVPGHYVRVWQRRDGGWKLIVDTMIADPRPPKRKPAHEPAG